MINRTNYEQYFLDYYESSLDAKTKEDLFVFLEQNPDLKDEFESFELITLDAEPHIAFPSKDKLHRNHVNENNHLNYLIAYLENDLQSQDLKETEEFIRKNPGAAEELEILRKLRIQPDKNIVYKDKESLKKQGRIIRLTNPVYRYAAIAASLIIILLSYSSLQRHKKENPMAEHRTDSLGRNPSQPEPEKQIVQTEAPRTATGQVQSPSSEEKNVKSNAPVKSRISKPAPVMQPNISPLPLYSALPVDENKSITENAPYESSLAANTPPSEVKSKNEMSPEPGLAELSNIFSAEELAELGVLKQVPAEQSSDGGWQLAETGVEKLAKVTGTKMELDKRRDQLENSTTYALAIGKFSFSHTRVKD